MSKKSNKKNRENAKEQLEHLKKKFGLSMNYVECTVPVTSSEMKKIFGKQCKDFEPTCFCCEAWREWHMTNKATITIERDSVLKLLLD